MQQSVHFHNQKQLLLEEVYGVKQDRFTHLVNLGIAGRSEDLQRTSVSRVAQCDLKIVFP
jgi:hypothetical protein